MRHKLCHCEKSDYYTNYMAKLTIISWISEKIIKVHRCFWRNSRILQIIISSMPLRVICLTWLSDVRVRGVLVMSINKINSWSSRRETSFKYQKSYSIAAVFLWLNYKIELSVIYKQSQCSMDRIIGTFLIYLCSKC